MKRTVSFPILDGLIQSLGGKEIDEKRHEWLSAGQVAAELGMHINSIYRIIHKGDLKSYNCSINGRKKLLLGSKGMICRIILIVGIAGGSVNVISMGIDKYVNLYKLIYNCKFNPHLMP
jgi:hypothetical protein